MSFKFSALQLEVFLSMKVNFPTFSVCFLLNFEQANPTGENYSFCNSYSSFKWK